MLTDQTAGVTATGHTNDEVQPGFLYSRDMPPLLWGPGKFPNAFILGFPLLLSWVCCTVLLQIRSILATGQLSSA